MEANKILSADVLDIIFEDRNKDYGAYDLRKSYNRRITKALIITASIALLALLGSFLASAMKDSDDKKIKTNEMTIQDIKQEDKPPPPPQEELKEVKIAEISHEGVKDIGIAAPAQIDEGKQIIEVKKVEDENKIFDKVEIEASFPGGDGKWRRYLEQNCNGQVATDGGAPEGTYTTIVQFIVDKEGNISDVKALTNHGYGMEGEAMRVIKKGPKWTPAVQNGNKVKAYRKQPITFQVLSE